MNKKTLTKTFNHNKNIFLRISQCLSGVSVERVAAFADESVELYTSAWSRGKPLGSQTACSEQVLIQIRNNHRGPILPKGMTTKKGMIPMISNATVVRF